MSAPGIAIMGAGSWGTALAHALAHTPGKPAITLWARRAATVTDINSDGHNRQYLPHVCLPERVRATDDPQEALHGATLVFVAVPTGALPTQAPTWRTHLSPDALVVSLMKGLDAQGRRASELLHRHMVIPERLCVLSGPNLAAEVAARTATAVVIASTNPEAAATVAETCAGGSLYPQTSGDVVGVEFGGIAKNMVALAAGICDGADQGRNAAAALMTFGFDEIRRLGRALGASEATLMGLAGLGDLLATCLSPLSRNYQLGKLLGQGVSTAAALERVGQTVEGVEATSSLILLAGQHATAMPLAQNVNDVLTGRASARDLVHKLLSARTAAYGDVARAC